MERDPLQRLRDWLVTYPQWDAGGFMYIDFTEGMPGSAGLYPTGLTVLESRRDVCGVLRQRCRYRFVLYRVTDRQEDNEKNARWLMDFQQWVRRQSNQGLAPAFGDEPAAERLYAQGGKLHRQEAAGTGLYTVELVAEFVCRMQTKGGTTAWYVDIRDTLNAEPIFQPLGLEAEQLELQLQPQVESYLDVLGNYRVHITGYRKQLEVPVLHAGADTALYERLRQILEGGLVLEDLRTRVVRADLLDYREPGYGAWQHDGWFEVLTWDSTAQGDRIAFRLHLSPKAERGVYDPEVGEFSPD